MRQARVCDISVSEFVRRVLELKRMLDQGKGSLGDLVDSMEPTIERKRL